MKEKTRIESAEEFADEFMLFRALHPARRKIRMDGVRRKSGPPKKLTASSEQLREMYIIRGMSARQIGEMYGVCAVTVRRALKRYGIRKE